MHEHIIKCKSFPLEAYFTVQKKHSHHPPYVSWSTGHVSAPKKARSLLAGQNEHSNAHERRLCGACNIQALISEPEL